MAKFMDVHTGFIGVTAEQLDEAHGRDLAIERTRACISWIWRPNPSGIFKDWNPKVTCRGNGDPLDPLPGVSVVATRSVGWRRRHAFAGACRAGRTWCSRGERLPHVLAGRALQRLQPRRIAISLAQGEQDGGGASELLAGASGREEEPPECSPAEHGRLATRGRRNGDRS